MNKIIFSKTNGAFPIVVVQKAPHTFDVRYGVSIEKNLSYLEAAHKVGEAIMHEAACSGRTIYDERQWDRIVGVTK